MSTQTLHYGLVAGGGRDGLRVARVAPRLITRCATMAVR